MPYLFAMLWNEPYKLQTKCNILRLPPSGQSIEQLGPAAESVSLGNRHYRQDRITK